MALALLVPAPLRPVPRMHGPRLVRIPSARVDAMTVALDERRIALVRHDAGWDVDGAPATPEVADAARDLLDTLGTLRALDAFRAGDAARFGLAPPRGTIVLASAGRDAHLLVGGPTADGSSVYARRDDDPRVLRVGAGLLSAVDRLLYAAGRR